MHRSRNIIKRFAQSRCPQPAFGKVQLGDPVANSIHANLANSCRKLYTELIASGREHLADIRWALMTRRRRENMSWLKATCGLKLNPDKLSTVKDYLSMPLKHCYGLEPRCINGGKRIVCVDANENNLNSSRALAIPSSRNVRVQNLPITADKNPLKF